MIATVRALGVLAAVVVAGTATVATVVRQRLRERGLVTPQRELFGS